MRVRVSFILALVLCSGAVLGQAVVLSGSADPQVVTLSAGQQVAVSYLIRNSSAQRLALQSSTADFTVNGIPVATVNLPANVTIPAGGVVVVPSNVSISQQIQNAAKAAGTDTVVMTRTFRAVLAAVVVQATIPVVIKIGSSMVGAASVTEVLLDVPRDGKTVARNEAIRAHAFIRGTGTGAIAGTWFVDGQPVETFQISILAGITQEVRTRLTLPTLELGPHTVELRIARPAPMTSNTQTYMVVQGTSSSQRVLAIQPSDGLPVATDAARTSFRWVPMPGAAGYELAFARDLSALGVDADGSPVSPLLNLQNWTRDSGKLIQLVTVPSDALSWTPSEDDFARLCASPSGKLVWAVRAIYPAQQHGDPSTTSTPRSLTLAPKPANLALVAPADAHVFRGLGDAGTEVPRRFEWQAGPEGVIYELAIASQGKTVYRALTRDTGCSLSALAVSKLAPGAYSWRVTAMKTGQGVVAASEKRSFVVAHSVAVIDSRTVSPTGAGAFIVAGGIVGALPGAASEIALTPADGSTIGEQQPTISATYPEAKELMLTLNGVDVTALAEVTPTSLTLQPPGVFNDGAHTIGLTVATSDGRTLESSSKFTIAAGSSEAPAADSLVDHPLQLNLDWNWNGDNNATASDTLTIDVNLRGQQNWAGMGWSSAAINAQLMRPIGEEFDLANFLTQGSVRGGDYKLIAGDIGSAASELTTGGSIYRAFSFISDAGPIKLSAAHTLGQAVQRSSIGSVPDMLYVTAESAQSTPEKGVSMSYVNSKSEATASQGFDGPTKSEVFSLSGRTPLASGLNLKADLARSDSTVSTIFGTQSQIGSAMNAALDGAFAGFGLSAAYRLIGSDYASPSSTTLTNNLKGWTLAANRPLGQFVTTSLNYSLLDSDAGSSAPASSVTSKSVDVSLAYPNLPSVTLQLAHNDSSADPFTVGTTGARTEENTWSVGSNYSTELWDAYLNYSKSDFTDYLDFLNPAIDTPNDRASGTWAFGFGVRPTKALRLRFDWGVNDSDRWFRPILSPVPLLGVDRSDQFRAQLEYLINTRFSSTLSLSNSDYADALGAYNNKSRNLSFRVNYLLRMGKSGGGLTITGELSHSDFAGSMFGDNGNSYGILVNDNRVLSF